MHAFTCGWHNAKPCVFWKQAHEQSTPICMQGFLQLTKLTQLALKTCWEPDWRSMLNVLAQLTKLECLHIHGVNQRPDQLPALSPLSALRCVTHQFQARHCRDAGMHPGSLI